MKMKLVSLAFLVFTMFSCQSSEKIHVPDVVKSKFSTMYPKASHPEWEMEGTNYEASFKEDKTETSVIISPDGNVIETETEMDAAQLPQPVNDFLAQLSGQKTESITKVVNATGTVSYEVEAGPTVYLFDVNGQVTGKEEAETGEGEDKD